MEWWKALMGPAWLLKDVTDDAHKLASGRRTEQNTNRLANSKARRARLRKLRLNEIIEQHRHRLEEQLNSTLAEHAVELGEAAIRKRSDEKYVVMLPDVNKGLRILKRARGALRQEASTKTAISQHYMVHFRSAQEIIEPILAKAKIEHGAMAGLDGDMIYHEAKDPFLKELHQKSVVKKCLVP